MENKTQQYRKKGNETRAADTGKNDA